MVYTIKYQAGGYSGKRQVNAEDEEEAISKVRSWVRREMTMPMYSDSYQVEATYPSSFFDEED